MRLKEGCWVIVDSLDSHWSKYNGWVGRVTGLNSAKTYAVTWLNLPDRFTGWGDDSWCRLATDSEVMTANY